MERTTDQAVHDAQDEEATTTIDRSGECLLDHGPSSPRNSATLTYLDAVALLISIQIGSGIFSSPSQVNKHTPGPGYALIIWLTCGLLAWSGAASYAELGTALPVSGSTQEYLRYVYGDGLAFLASWIWILGIKPCGMAALSIVATQYWLSFIFGSTVSSDGWQCKILALAIHSVIVLINMFGVNVTKAMNKFMSALKLFTLLLLLLLTLIGVVLGFTWGDEKPTRDWARNNWFSHTNPDWNPRLWPSVGEYTLAIYAGLWSFSGWDSVNIVAGDLKDTSRNLPRAIHTSQPMVIVSFVLANICYYMTIPWREIDANNTIAVTFGSILLGWVGRLVFAVLVSMACLGAVNVNVFAMSRLVVSAAQANWLPQSLGSFSSVRLHWTPKQGHSQTPVRAMVFVATIVSVYIVTGTFATLVTFIELAEYAFFAATVIGLLILRVREPDLPRPYKPTIIFPVLFSSVSVALLFVGVVKAPVQAALLGLLMATGFVTKSERTRSIWHSVSRKEKTRNVTNYGTLIQ